MRRSDDQDLPVPRFHRPPLGRDGARRQGQPPPQGVRPQKHRLCRGTRRLRW